MRLSNPVACLALAAALATPSLAQPPAKTQTNQCLVRRSIDGFSAPNDRTLYVRVGVRDVWRFDLMVDCIGMDFHNAVALESQPPSPWICSPLDATVIIRQTGITQRCPVTALHKLTPEEFAALPKRDRP